MVEQELSIPETILLVHPATNKSQSDPSYLNNCIHQVFKIRMSLCAVQIHMHRKLLKVF